MCIVFVTYVECKYMDLIETVPVNKCVIYMKNKLDSLWSFNEKSTYVHQILRSTIDKHGFLRELQVEL